MTDEKRRMTAEELKSVIRMQGENRAQMLKEAEDLQGWLSHLSIIFAERTETKPLSRFSLEWFIDFYNFMNREIAERESRAAYYAKDIERYKGMLDDAGEEDF